MLDYRSLLANLQAARGQQPVADTSQTSISSAITPRPMTAMPPAPGAASGNRTQMMQGALSRGVRSIFAPEQGQWASPMQSILSQPMQPMQVSDERLAELILRTSDDGMLHLKDEPDMNAALRELQRLRAEKAWLPIETAPRDGKKMLVAYRNTLGKWRTVIAVYAAKFTMEQGDEFLDWGDYDEETDCYYLPEGWYECIENWDDYSSVHIGGNVPTHWMPLPPPPVTP